MTNWDGLRRFRPDDRLDIWRDWRLWPHVSIVLDRGSDGVAGVAALLYSKEHKLNCSVWFDNSHDGWRSVLEAVRDNGLYGFIILVMIACNLLEGPDGTDLRYNQLRSASADLFKNTTPKTNALFRHYFRDLRSELDDRLPLDETTDVDKVWTTLRSWALARPKKYRLHLNRFQGVVSEGTYLLSHWYSSLCVAEFAALELDFMKSADMTVKLKLPATGADAQADTSTTKAVQVDARAIRAAAQNAVVVTVLLLQQSTHRRLLQMIVDSAMPVTMWHGVQNRACRDVAKGADWAVGQVTGDFMEHISLVMGALVDEAAATRCGFAIAGGENAKFIFNAGEVSFEDEMAQTWGNIVLSLVVARIKRALPQLVGYPWSLLGALKGEAHRDAILKAFELHYHDHERMKVQPNINKGMRKIIDRSVFQQLSVLQLANGLKESGWGLNPDVERLLTERSRTCFGTQIVEDVNNVQKNDRSLGGAARSSSNHFRRPESSMAAALARQVVNKIHHFNPIDIKEAIARKTAALASNVFESAHGSMPWNSIATTKQAPSYFSPGAENFCLPSADLALVREVCRTNTIPDIGDAWLGLWCRCSHQVLFRWKDAPHAWFFGLHHFPDSAILVWPVQLLEGVLKDGHILIVPRERVDPPELKVCMSLEAVEGTTFTWKSWSWQRSVLKDRTPWRPGVRAVHLANQPVEAMIRVLARNAFFSLTKTNVEDLCNHEGYELEDTGTLFSTVFSAVRSVLKTSDESTLAIMRQRFARLPSETTYTGELLALDEADMCLDDADKKEMKRLMEKSAEDHVDKRTFSKHLQQKREQISKKAAAKGAAKKAKTTPSVPGYKGPKSMPKASQIEQAELKEFVPPGSFIWVARHAGAWMTRYPPFKAQARYWKREGSELAAAKAALQDVWVRYLEANGLELDVCPIAGLMKFDASASEASASSGAASSSSGGAGAKA